MIDMAKRIRSVGESAGRVQRGYCVKKVRCQGCGEEICSDGDLSEVDWVKTNRGSEWFFHRKCRDSVWGRKIL